MNDLIDQLTALRLHGMAACAHDLLSARKPPSLTIAIKQLVDAEIVERRVRSIQHQMRSAKFPHHKDFALLRLQRSHAHPDPDRALLFRPIHPRGAQSHPGWWDRHR